MAKDTNFVRRRVSWYTLGAYPFAFVCEGAYPYSFRTRIGVCRIMFFNGFPVKGHVLKRFNFRATRFFRRVIFDTCAFKRAIVEGVKGNMGRINRIFLYFIRFYLWDFTNFFSFNCAYFDYFDVFFLPFFRRLPSEFKRQIRFYRIFVWLVLHTASFIVRYGRLFCHYFYVFGVLLFRSTSCLFHVLYGLFGNGRVFSIFLVFLRLVSGSEWGGNGICRLFIAFTSKLRGRGWRE